MKNYFNQTYLKILLGTISICQNWPHVLFAKLTGWPIKNIKLRNGIVFPQLRNKLDKAGLSVLSEIWYENLYTPAFMEIAQNDIVFDVGCNKGYFAVQAGLKARQGKVYCFEPVPELIEQIKMNLSANQLANVFPFPLAMSAKSGELEFYLSSDFSNSGHSVFHTHLASGKISVKAETIENFCSQNGITKINFLKLDCEGSEYDILLNIEPGFLKTIDKISLEFHDYFNEHRHPELISHLKNNNFLVAVKDTYIYALNLAPLK